MSAFDEDEDLTIMRNIKEGFEVCWRSRCVLWFKCFSKSGEDESNMTPTNFREDCWLYMARKMYILKKSL